MMLDKGLLSETIIVGRWSKDKDVKIQINKYHKLLEDIKTKNIVLPDEFDSKLLFEKLSQS